MKAINAIRRSFKRTITKPRNEPPENLRVNAKVLWFFGDDALQASSARAVTAQDRQRARAFPKAVRILGEPSLISATVQNKFGQDMTAKQKKAAILHQENTMAATLKQQLQALQERINAKPSKDQLALPEGVSHVNQKALDFFGDETLAQLSRLTLTAGMRSNICPKIIHFFGDSSLLSRKQLQILGPLESRNMII